MAAGAVPLLMVEVRQTSCARKSGRCLVVSRKWPSAEPGCHHCSRCCPAAHCSVEVRPASCATPGSRGFAGYCEWCSAESRRHHCSRCCASACCFAEVRQANLLRIAADTLEILAAGSQHNKDAIIAAGAMPLLVAALRSDQPKVQEQVSAALGILALGSQHTKDAIIAAGAVPALVCTLSSDQPNVQGHAASSLNWIPAEQGCHHCSRCCDSARCLVEVRQAWCAEQVAGALGRLAVGSQYNKDAIIAAGAVPLLVALFSSDPPNVLQEAVCALCLVRGRMWL